MAKKIGKEPSWEQQKKLLLDSVALKMPLLHQSLVAAYGEEEGRRIYDDLYEVSYKKRLQHFKDKDIVDVISAEIDVFPALGWKIWMDVCEENGEKVCYEHLEHCPHLEATRAYKLPEPCAILCDLD